MGNIKEQLQQLYPIMKEKQGLVIHSCPDPLEILKKNRKSKVLVLMCGIEGAGKTTFTKQHLSDYQVLSFDDMLEEYCKTHEFKGNAKENSKLNAMFYKNACSALQKDLTVLDCASHTLGFRCMLLETLKNHYDKVILFVLNPDITVIFEHIDQDIFNRIKPNLFQEISKQYTLFRFQIQEHILEMGVDEVYFLKP